jgi:predicted permease
MNNLLFAARQLARTPGFTVLAVLTLALGIGACAAIFTVVQAVLLRPFPFGPVERLMVINESRPGQPTTTIGTGLYGQWKTHARSFDQMGALAGQSYNLTGAGPPEHLLGGRITASMLPTLGVNPALGRNFLPEEEHPYGLEDRALLGHALWQDRFAGARDVVGKTIRLNGRAFLIVGVMPRETGLPAAVQVFTPLGFTADQRRGIGFPYLHVVGRLQPGASPEQARGELTALFEQTARTMGAPSPQSRGRAVKITPLVETMVGKVRPALMLLSGAVGLLLLIACTNVASLLLARATARSGELAVRAALGASRGRLMSQLLIESLMLSLLAGAVGLVLAHAGLGALLAIAPEELPRGEAIALDGRALAATMTVAVLSAAISGLVPALQGSRVQLHDALKQASRSARAGAGLRLRRAFVVGQVAMALVLLTGAGLLMRTFARLQEVNPGFNPAGGYVAELFLPRPQYTTDAQYISFAQGAMDEMGALPGVEAVAVANMLPFNSRLHFTFASLARVTVAGRPTGPGDDGALATAASVSAAYFRAMGIPLLQGRTFDGRDVAEGAPTAIISEAVARRLFPEGNALGRAVVAFGGQPREVVGIVGDVKQASLEAGATMQIYAPFAQNPDNDMIFVVRARPTSDQALLFAGIRRAATRADGNLPVFDVRPLEALVGAAIARQRFSMTVFGVFSSVALVLAIVGVYGVLVHSVSQRTGEIALRMALGATSTTVARLVLSEGGRLVALGVAAGLIGALFLSGMIDKLLFGVPSRDPWTFAAVAGLMALVAVPACLVPALRATYVQPMAALRKE